MWRTASVLTAVSRSRHEWQACAKINTGGHLPWFWVRMCGWSPRTPPNSYTRPSEKHDPFIYFPYRKLTPFIYYFWKLTPFIYYFSNFTHSYTFWMKKIPHWYTFDVKMIPIHILWGLKSIPHSSRTSVYTFIMEVTPPWKSTMTTSKQYRSSNAFKIWNLLSFLRTHSFLWIPK